MMRQVLIQSFVCASLLIFGVNAQGGPRQDEDYNRIADQTAANLFRQVQVDLDHAQQEMPSHADAGDLDRFDHAQAALRILEREWDEGYYRQRQSKDVIDALWQVVGVNQLSPQNRDRLNNDLNQLREFRNNHKRY